MTGRENRPLQETDSSGGIGQSSVSSPVALECALVVDDDPVLLEVATSLLRKRGMRDVVRAGNGSVALAALSRRRGDVSLILCDLQMPEMDGIAFLRGLATERYTG